MAQQFSQQDYRRLRDKYTELKTNYTKDVLNNKQTLGKILPIINGFKSYNIEEMKNYNIDISVLTDIDTARLETDQAYVEKVKEMVSNFMDKLYLLIKLELK